MAPHPPRLQTVQQPREAVARLSLGWEQRMQVHQAILSPFHPAASDIHLRRVLFVVSLASTSNNSEPAKRADNITHFVFVPRRHRRTTTQKAQIPCVATPIISCPQPRTKPHLQHPHIPSAKMSQTSHPTLINLPPGPSNPDTPEIPGTPTSTTTSLSALSTTAIKDGHKGTVHHHPHPLNPRGLPPQYDPSNSSLEAERADRISRLTGLAPAAFSRQQQFRSGQQQPIQPYTQTQQFQPPTGIAYFDAQGQPQMQNKMSTVGSASATEVSPSLGGGSVSGRSRTTTMRGREDGDEDMLTEMDSASVAGGSGYVDEDMMIDEMDDDGLSRRSAGTYDEEDDGRESLVGFGEGAGSTGDAEWWRARGDRGLGEE
ncbi:hypothetical protein QC764_509725 [Podospora pseudoanserina]|uniref:Uncharacterized protein n=2 Tax=Podospora TaxID=5144 RepID=A0ABR0I7M1_9PEZI|nr:hypothetical protein QC764_509725 [Podospora pseudoanserina]